VKRALAFVLGAACAPGLAAAEIYRCAAATGVTYQQEPCQGGAIVAIPAEFPAVNLAERERILQREAALEKRLEARRERELQEAALRVRLAESAPAQPLVVPQPAVGFVYVVPPAPHFPRRTRPQAMFR
jgi:hypothetical protein